jgi:hypothetical protein
MSARTVPFIKGYLTLAIRFYQSLGYGLFQQSFGLLPPDSRLKELFTNSTGVFPRRVDSCGQNAGHTIG